MKNNIFMGLFGNIFFSEPCLFRWGQLWQPISSRC